MAPENQFTNIDFLGIGKPCNNFGKCRQCFLGDVAANNGNLEEDASMIGQVMENYPGSSFFFYPAEFATSMEYARLMRKAGQKAMTNGKRPGIAAAINEAGFSRMSFSLYSDLEEMDIFYGYSEQEYACLLENIQSAASLGIEVEVFSILTPLNYQKLPQLYSLADRLGVTKISLLPLVPGGRAKKMEDRYFLNQETLEKAIDAADGVKNEDGPYLSLGLGFGPSKSAIERFGSQDSWVKTATLCPAIGNEYAAVNVSERSVYWCFKVLGEPWGRIGKIGEGGVIALEDSIDLSPGTLKEKLQGMCGGCPIKGDCLGGCRSQAILFALKEDPGQPIEKAIYSGQPFCRYTIDKGAR